MRAGRRAHHWGKIPAASTEVVLAERQIPRSSCAGAYTVRCGCLPQMGPLFR
jgi:hypothetical protein